MVIGGYRRFDLETVGQVTEVEVIDTANPSADCPAIPDYPIAVDRLTAAFIDGRVVACGGITGVPGDVTRAQDDCYELGQDLAWTEFTSMPYGRNYNMASSVVRGTWVITGGNNHLTENLYFDGLFSPGPTFPAELKGHCQVTVDYNHVLVTANGGEFGGKTFMMDWRTQVWSPLEDVPYNKMGQGACGLANGEVVLVDNYRSYIYSFTDGTGWRAGNPLPDPTDGLASVQAGGTFLTVGGVDSDTGSFSDKIYRFNVDTYDWDLLEAKLATSRSNSAVVALPDDFLQCS